MAAYLLALAALVPAPAVFAQAESGTALPGSLDFLEVSDVKAYTGHILVDGTPQTWTGEGLHAGIQVFGFVLHNGKEIPRDFEVPANPAAYCTISDMNGNVVGSTESDMTNTFNRIKFTKNFRVAPAFSLGVTRGGKYKLTGGLSPDLYTYEETIVLKDEPGAQVSGSVVKFDEGLNPIVTITSGYPYDPQAIAGEHSLRWTVASAADPSKVIADNTETFVLASETETLAAIAELILAVPDIEPGEYLFTLTSDYTPANRTFKAIVNDVLHPELSLDKPSYVFGTDREAVLSISMSYGYPYIALDAATQELTVTVNPIFLERSNPTYFSDPAWADTKMQLDKDIHIPFENVTLEALTENKGRLPLRVLISFNRETQYEDTLEVAFDYDSAGIGSVTASAPGTCVKYYNVSGVEVDENYRGLVIASDGSRQYIK